MARISVLGGTGYAGSHIVEAARRRGHTVTAFSRSAPATRVDGVTYVQGSAVDEAVIDRAFREGDVVIAAVAPRGDMLGKVLPLVRTLEQKSAATGKRLGVIGGAGSLRVAPDGPRVLDLPQFPDAFKPEATEMAEALHVLQAEGTKSDWFYVSPAVGFNSHAVGVFTGKYRVGDDVALSGPEGPSTISGADFGDAVVSEIESRAHVRRRFTVGY